MKEKLSFVSNNMKSFRARANLTQEDTAKLLGVSRATYNDYEVNPQNVKIETFSKLSKIFHCRIVDFFVEINVTNSDSNN